MITDPDQRAALGAIEAWHREYAERCRDTLAGNGDNYGAPPEQWRDSEALHDAFANTLRTALAAPLT